MLSPPRLVTVVKRLLAAWEDGDADRGVEGARPCACGCPFRHRHGSYSRFVVVGFRDFRLVIPRLYCPWCHRTEAVLPSWLSRHFVYPACLRQAAMVKYLAAEEGGYGRRLKVSGIGRIRVRWHRPIEGTVKTVRIVKRADGWYACFSCEVETKPLPETGEAVGIDVGVASLITASEGEKTPHPGWYRTEQAKLRVLQRAVARKKKGGSNRRKAVVALKRHHQRISNRREDFLNHLAYELIQRYDVIGLEDLRIPNMVRNPHLAKSILDAGWGYLVTHLTYKAAEAGHEVVLVNPAYTSKTCSGCGAIFDSLMLADRQISCSCGISLDRDHNAAGRPARHKTGSRRRR